jgi:aminopeptidase
MTPTIFCEEVINKFKGIKNINIIERDLNWIKDKNMNSFLSVAKGR